jgi:N-acetylneuraminic acid mutarotase
MILTNSTTPPPGYSSTGYQIVIPGNTGWSTDFSLKTAISNVAACNFPLPGSVWLAGTSGTGTILQSTNLNGGSGLQATIPTAASAPGVACLNGKVYVFGGYDTTSFSALSANQIYDTSANTWSTGAAMPTARWSPGVVSVNGLIYAIGGGTSINLNTGAETYSATVEIYNPSSNTWSTGPSLPQSVPSSAAVVNGTIYVIAGSGVPVYSFNPSTDTSWSTKSLPPAGVGPSGVAGDSSGLVYAVGGTDNFGNRTGEMAVYNTTTDSWTTAGSMPILNGMGVVVSMGVIDAAGIVYVYGGLGIGNSSPTASVQSFNYGQYVPVAVFYGYVKN